MKNKVILPGNVAMPVPGFGTGYLNAEGAKQAVTAALQVGYRHFDTALSYHNHPGVGAALVASELERTEYFISTKVYFDHLAYDQVLSECERALNELQTDYLDLFLIHWPNNDTPLAETFQAMAKLIQGGKIRHTGVCNFTIKRLTDALVASPVPLAVNQVEYHPYLNQQKLARFCRQNNIAIIAYSPLAKGKILADPQLQKIAADCHKSIAQVSLRWLVQKGFCPIPRTTRIPRMQENAALFDWSLTNEQMQAIDTINQWIRTENYSAGEFELAE